MIRKAWRILTTTSDAFCILPPPPCVAWPPPERRRRVQQIEAYVTTNTQIGAEHKVFGEVRRRGLRSESNSV